MSNILVTGSNSGFGKLTVLALARRGHTVFATMRDAKGKNRAAAEELRATRGITVLDLDVTSDASVNDAVASAIASAGHLDVAINNAGFAVGGLNETITSAQLLRQLDANVVGMQRVNRAVLPGMRDRKSGLLVHLSSGLGRVLIPFVGIYAATKWAVEAIAETYRYELKPTGIDVAIVQPGAFPTNFGGAMEAGSDQARAAGYGPLANGFEMFAKSFEQMFAVPNPPDPQEVADAIVELVEAPAGKRPARVVVDRFRGDGPRALNEAHAGVQRALLGGMGMPFLAD